MSYAGQRLAFPPLTRAIKHLMIANAVVFVLNMLLVGRLSAPTPGGGGFWFAFSWSGLWEGYGLGLLRLVTYQFTHSFGDPMHFLLNMLVLYFFGTMAEHRLGYRGAIKLYLAGGAAGALLHLMIAAVQGNADVYLVGASGACYAFLVYAATMAPNTEVIFLIVRLPIWVLAAVLVGIGLYSTFVEFAQHYSGGTSHGAHLGGALIGFAAFRLGWFVDFGLPGGAGPLRRMLASWRGSQERRARQRAAEENEQLDAILAKVKERGIGALSPSERRFLERASAKSRDSRHDRR